MKLLQNQWLLQFPSWLIAAGERLPAVRQSSFSIAKLTVASYNLGTDIVKCVQVLPDAWTRLAICGQFNEDRNIDSEQDSKDKDDSKCT